jgi:hypothetical protein
MIHIHLSARRAGLDGLASPASGARLVEPRWLDQFVTFDR